MANQNIFIENLQTGDGEVHSRISPEIRDFAMAFNTFSKKAIPITQKFKLINKDMRAALFKVAQCCDQIKQVSLDFAKIYREFNDAAPFGKIPQPEELFKGLSAMFDSWRKTSLEKMVIFNKVFERNIKYIKNELGAMNEVIFFNYVAPKLQDRYS